MEAKDILTYLLAGLSLIAAIVGIFSKTYQSTVLIGGLIGLGISIIYLRINEYLSQLDKNTKDIIQLKNNYDIYKKYEELKKEIEVLKILTNKKGKIDSSNVLLIIFVFILIYLILLSLGIIPE